MKLWHVSTVLLIGSFLCAGRIERHNTVDDLNKQLERPFITDSRLKRLAFSNSYEYHKLHHTLSCEDADLQRAIRAFQGDLNPRKRVKRSLYVHDRHGKFPLASAISGGNANAVETILQEHADEGMWPFSVEQYRYTLPLELALCRTLKNLDFERIPRIKQRINILQHLY